MSDDFELPEDPAEFTAWFENFADRLPEFAKQLNIPPEQLKEVQATRAELVRRREEVVRLEWADLTRRLNQFCPREEWPAVYADAAERLILTPEPVRGHWLKVLEDWFEGIRRVQGHRIQPKLTTSRIPAGFMVDYAFPERVDMMRFYVRPAGAAGWTLRCCTAGPRYGLLLATDAEMDEETAAEKRAWHGKAMEIVAVAQLEERPLGFPSEIVTVQVPDHFEPETASRRQ